MKLITVLNERRNTMSVFNMLLNESKEWTEQKEKVESLEAKLVSITEGITNSSDADQRLRLSRKKNGIILALNNAKRKLDVIEDDILVNYTNTYNRKALGYDCGIVCDEYYERVFEQNGLFKGVKF